MSKLSEALQATRARVGGPKCLVCEAVTLLDSADQETLTEALASEFTSNQIRDALLAAYNIDLPVGSIRRHRRKECATHNVS